MCIVLWIVVCAFVFCLVAIVLSVLQFTASDYHFVLFKLLLMTIHYTLKLKSDTINSTNKRFLTC
jgi:hypothetical protein